MATGRTALEMYLNPDDLELFVGKDKNAENWGVGHGWRVLLFHDKLYT